MLIYENGTLRIADFGCARKVILAKEDNILPDGAGGDNSAGISGGGATLTANTSDVGTSEAFDEFDDMPSECPTSLVIPTSTSTTSPPPPVTTSSSSSSSFTSSPITSSSSSFVFDSIGTEVFYSPEICQGKGYDIFQADVWAAGCCLCCFMNDGLLPFDPRLPYDTLMNSILKDPPTLNSMHTPPLYFHHSLTDDHSSSNDTSSPSVLFHSDKREEEDDEWNTSESTLRKLILGLLEKDCSKRMNLEQAENHEWLSTLPPDLLLKGGGN